MEELRLATEDGFDLPATIFELTLGRNTEGPAVLFSSATAVQRRFYRTFAQYVADNGAAGRDDLRLSRHRHETVASRSPQRAHVGLGDPRSARCRARIATALSQFTACRLRPLFRRPGAGIVRHRRPLRPLHDDRRRFGLSRLYPRSGEIVARHEPRRLSGCSPARPSAALGRHRRIPALRRLQPMASMVQFARLFLFRCLGSRKPSALPTCAFR